MKANVNRGKKKNKNVCIPEIQKTNFNNRNNNHNVSNKLKSSQNLTKGRPYRRNG